MRWLVESIQLIQPLVAKRRGELALALGFSSLVREIKLLPRRQWKTSLGLSEANSKVRTNYREGLGDLGTGRVRRTKPSLSPGDSGPSFFLMMQYKYLNGDERGGGIYRRIQWGRRPPLSRDVAILQERVRIQCCPVFSLLHLSSSLSSFQVFWKHTEISPCIPLLPGK